MSICRTGLARVLADGHSLSAELVVDPSLTLPRMLAHKDIATVFALPNKIRNDYADPGEFAGTRNASLSCLPALLADAVG
jgi:hypothetical protein